MKTLVQGIDPLLSDAIVGTISEPLVVLNQKLCVLVANPAFYKKFRVKPQDVEGKLFYKLGDGQWSVPELRTLLEHIIPDKTQVDGYEVTSDIPQLGKKIMLINAREIKYENGQKKMLLTIQDITEQRRLMHQKDTLLKEMRHRIANSLQLIASILILKAGSVQSEESRMHLQNAHDRIISIATVQKNLDPTGDASEVPVVEYLKVLCKSLAKSMIGGRKPISITVTGSTRTVTPDDAICLGLITTELVINSLKHAFPRNKGKISVTYQAHPVGWTFSVRDDGVGFPKPHLSNREGLGTNIIDSLANQLSAKITRKSIPKKGTIVSITHTLSDTSREVSK